MKCAECENAGKCLDHREQPSLIGCTSGVPERHVLTNMDYIRSITDKDEMAQFLLNVNSAYAMDCMTGMADCKHENEENGCLKCFREWLGEEYKEEKS